MTQQIEFLTAPPHKFVSCDRPTFEYAVGDRIVEIENLLHYRIKKIEADLYYCTQDEFNRNLDVLHILRREEFRATFAHIIKTHVGGDSFKIGNYVRIKPTSVDEIMFENGWKTQIVDNLQNYDYYAERLETWVAKIVDFTKYDTLIVNFMPTPEVKGAGLESINFELFRENVISMTQEQIIRYRKVVNNGTLGEQSAELRAYNLIKGISNYQDRLKLGQQEEEEKKKKLDEDAAGGPYELDYLLGKILNIKKWNKNFEDHYIWVTSVDNKLGHIHVNYYDSKIKKTCYFRAAEGVLNNITIVGNVVFSDEEV